MNARHRTPRRLALALTLAAAAACGPASQRGQLSVELVDAPNPDVTEIWVNVTSVRAHASPGGWLTVTEKPVRVDLLKLQDHAEALGLVSLQAAKVTQLRLLVAEDADPTTGVADDDNYVVVAGQRRALKVPSGYQSGIKIHGPWKVEACSRTSVTLDFDGLRSIGLAAHPIGADESWILRPVIHTKKSAREDIPCEQVLEVPGEEGEKTACSASSPCQGGWVCVGGACLGEPPVACSAAIECASGVCDAGAHCAPGGVGKPCATGEGCLSGSCIGQKCVAGGPGTSCRDAADCTTGDCQEDGTCAPGLAGGAGAACSVNSDCFSNSCLEAGCEPGVQGTHCQAPEDCFSGLCVESTCEPKPAG